MEKTEELHGVGKYAFDPPLLVTMTTNDEGYVLCCDEGQFYETGATRDEVLSELAATIDHVWQKYIESDPGKMSEGAIAYKGWIV